MTVKDLTEAAAWCVMAALVAILALIVVMAYRTAPAHAGWPDDEFRAQHSKNIVRRHVHKRREVRKAIIIRPERKRDDDGLRCLAPITVIGDQHVTREGAKREAVKLWRSTVRWRHGERFMDFEAVAKNATFQCTQSSIGNVATNITNTNLDRCELIVAPCAAPRLGGEGRQ